MEHITQRSSKGNDVQQIGGEQVKKAVKNTVQVGFRMPESLKRAIDMEAVKNERTFTQQVVFELRRNHPEATNGAVEK